MPLCSVIMPVYKAEATVAASIESVLAQTLTDWELVIVDDGSPDQCGKICDEYAAKDSRIRVIHQQNKGVSAARNAALDALTGQWIFLLDADDKLSPITLELAMQQQQAHPDDLIYWDHCHEYDKLCLEIPDQLNLTETGLEKLGTLWAVEYTIGYATNKLFKTELVKKGNARFPENLIYMEDTHFALDYYRALLAHNPKARLYHMPLGLYYYETNTGSITHTHGQQYTQRQFDGVPAVIRAARDFGCDAQQLDLIHHHYLSCVTHGLGLIEDKAVVRKFFKCKEAKDLADYFKSEHFYTAMYVPYHLHSRALIRYWERTRSENPGRYAQLDWGIYKLFYSKWRRL